jgi:hypothetical protein
MIGDLADLQIRKINGLTVSGVVQDFGGRPKFERCPPLIVT